MSENKTFDICPIMPGAQTVEGQKRISKAIEDRQECDYRAYMLLVSLRDAGLLSKPSIRAAAKAGGCDADEVEEALDYANQVDDVIRARRNLDNEFLAAVAGRPAR